MSMSMSMSIHPSIRPSFQGRALPVSSGLHDGEHTFPLQRHGRLARPGGLLRPDSHSADFATGTGTRPREETGLKRKRASGGIPASLPQEEFRRPSRLPFSRPLPSGSLRRHRTPASPPPGNREI